jgi:ComF family protein
MSFGRELVADCLHLVWPARCAGCNELLASDKAIFCGLCAQGINPIGRACGACARPQLGLGPRLDCAGCARSQFAFSRAVAGYEYGASLAAAIVRMKHGDRPDIARRLARLLMEPLRQIVWAGPVVGGGPPARELAVDTLVPVPLHPRKLRRRGFNQALELARGVLRELPDLAARGLRLERNLLRRVRDTRELGHMGPRERRAEVEGAFAVEGAARAERRRFLIVDDVMTTGATLSACAKALLQAGAADVRVLTLARAG